MDEINVKIRGNVIRYEGKTFTYTVSHSYEYDYEEDAQIMWTTQITESGFIVSEKSTLETAINSIDQFEELMEKAYKRKLSQPKKDF